MLRLSKVMLFLIGLVFLVSLIDNVEAVTVGECNSAISPGYQIGFGADAICFYCTDSGDGCVDNVFGDNWCKENNVNDPDCKISPCPSGTTKCADGSCKTICETPSCTSGNDRCCLPENDSICDPNCAEGIDPDCFSSKEEPKPVERECSYYGYSTCPLDRCERSRETLPCKDIVEKKIPKEVVDKGVDCSKITQKYKTRVIKDNECKNGVCEITLGVRAKHPCSDVLSVKFSGVEENDKKYNVIFSDSSKSQSFDITGNSILDVTSSAIRDLTGNAVAEEPKSRIDCALKSNPGFCCPAGYITSSDGNRCVAEPKEYCADFNSDNEINFEDYFMLNDNWGAVAGESGYNNLVDLDENGRIGFGDFFIFADNFGKEPTC